MASAFAAVPANDNERFSADWAKDNDRRAAEQRAEAQRHADYLARLTQEQEEHENREAREVSLRASAKDTSLNDLSYRSRDADVRLTPHFGLNSDIT